MRLLGIVSLLVCAQVVALPSSPAVVHLRDGRHMSGTIVSETVENLLLDTPDQRRWRIPRVLIDDVRRLMQPASGVEPASRLTAQPSAKPPPKNQPAAGQEKANSTTVPKKKSPKKPAPAKTAEKTTDDRKAPPKSTTKPKPAVKKKPAPAKTTEKTTDDRKAPPKSTTKPKPAVKKKPAPAKTAEKTTDDRKAPPKSTTKPKPAVKKKPAAKKKPAKGKWSHDVRLGLDLRYTAVTQQTFHSRIKSTYASKALRNLLDWKFAYGKTADKVSADRMFGLMKTDWTFDSGLYVYHTGSAGYDIVRRIALLYEIGPGFGYHVLRGRKLIFDDSKFSLDLETGGEYEDKLSTTGRRTERYFWRIAQLIRWNINRDLTFTEEFEYFPQVGALVNSRYRAEANFAYRLIKNLSLNITVQAEADPQQLSDFVPDDVQIRSSLGWRF